LQPPDRTKIRATGTMVRIRFMVGRCMDGVTERDEKRLAYSSAGEGKLPIIIGLMKSPSGAAPGILGGGRMAWLV
jgi:hypothetical protein